MVFEDSYLFSLFAVTVNKNIEYPREENLKNVYSFFVCHAKTKK